MFGLATIVIFALVLVAATKFLPSDWQKEILRETVELNMIFIALLGAKLGDYSFGISNVGNLLYGTVFLCQFILIRKFGETSTRKTTHITLYCFALAVILRLLISFVPTVPGNEAVSDALRILVKTNSQFALASFLAFYASQQAIIFIARRTANLHFLLSYLLVCFFGQIVDSIVFFPIAFAVGLPINLTAGEIGLTGFGVKIAFAVLSLVVVWWWFGAHPEKLINFYHKLKFRFHQQT